MNPTFSFAEILQRQAEANNIMVGSDAWLTDMKRYDNRSTIRDESGEAAESGGWLPWWKKTEPKLDYANLQLEIVDIYHFHVSGLLQEGHRDGVSMDALAVMMANEATAMAELSAENEANGHTEEWHPGMVNDYLGAALFLGYMHSLDAFYGLVYRSGMTVESLHAKYMAKNTLNRFRTANGAKAGTYQKIWAEGREDNYFVMVLVDKLVGRGDELTIDGLYDEIGSMYKFYTGKEPV